MIAQQRNDVSIECMGTRWYGVGRMGQIAPVFCGYDMMSLHKLDGFANHAQPFADIHANLRQRIRISASEVRALYHYRYLALLHVTNDSRRTSEVISERTGLVLSWMGWRPKEVSPNCGWCGNWRAVDLRCGWMINKMKGHSCTSAADCRFGLRVTAVVSDKQRGLLQPCRSLRDAKHAFCQIHYLAIWRFRSRSRWTMK